MPPHVPGLCFCRRRLRRPGLRSEGEEQKCRLHRAAWWQALPAGGETGMASPLAMPPYAQLSSLPENAVRCVGMCSELHRASQRAASAHAAHCIFQHTSVHLQKEWHRNDYRAAPARPTGNATMANERYRNSHYIPFHQLKLCAEILRKALSALYLHPLKPKQHHGFPNPRNTIRHRADRQAGVLSGGRVRRPYALPPIPHAPPLAPATAVFCGAQPLIMACRLVQVERKS